MLACGTDTEWAAGGRQQQPDLRNAGAAEGQGGVVESGVPSRLQEKCTSVPRARSRQISTVRWSSTITALYTPPGTMTMNGTAHSKDEANAAFAAMLRQWLTSIDGDALFVDDAHGRTSLPDIPPGVANSEAGKRVGDMGCVDNRQRGSEWVGWVNGVIMIDATRCPKCTYSSQS
jgi:hypothetical protein